jgi:hypothetical protein
VKENSVKTVKICNETIEEEIDYAAGAIDDVSDYLLANTKINIDIICCVDISVSQIYGQVKKTDLTNAMQNNLLSSNERYNTIFFKQHTCPKKEDSYTEVFNSELNSFATSVIERLLTTQNRITSVVCWPSWIVFNYFLLFKRDSIKFKSSIIIAKCGKYVDVIAVASNLSMLCYRRLDERNFLENEEILETMKYIVRMQGIELEDMAVYCLSDDTIRIFTKKMDNSMKFVSTVITQQDIFFKEYQHYFKIALRVACGCFFGYCTTLCKEVIAMNKRLDTICNFNRCIDPALISERVFWQNIPDFRTERISYKRLISDILKATGNTQISDICIQERDGNLCINILPLDNSVRSNCSKEINFEKYKLKISVSDNGVICDGKYC